MSTSGPVVSVVMAAYNEERWIKRAIDSILNQTLTNLELIVVDDGSSDRTADVLATIQDKRLVTISQTNQGLARSLNQGIVRANSDYIARLDADDWSAPDRLARQVDFLKAKPDYGLVGSACRIELEDGSCSMHFAVPTTDMAIRRRIVWENPFVHSSVVMRKRILEDVGGYRAGYRWEDYELWWRMIQRCRVANFAEELVVRTDRIHSVSKVSKSRYYWEKVRIQSKAARYQDVTPLIYVSILRSSTFLAIHRLLEALPGRESI